MDFNAVINELRQAWDALEGLSVSGYSTRARIQTAQEMILSVYNAVNKAKKAENADEALADAMAEADEE